MQNIIFENKDIYVEREKDNGHLIVPKTGEGLMECFRQYHSNVSKISPFPEGNKLFKTACGNNIRIKHV